jgi:hypothetical protein
MFLPHSRIIFGPRLSLVYPIHGFNGLALEIQVHCVTFAELLANSKILSKKSALIVLLYTRLKKKGAGKIIT